MLKIGEVMTLTSRVIAHAAARKPGHRAINAFIAFGLNVRPWKRAVAWVCLVLNAICFGFLAACTGHPLWLLFPVISTMTALEYLNNTRAEPAPQVQGRRPSSIKVKIIKIMLLLLWLDAAASLVLFFLVSDGSEEVLLAALAGVLFGTAGLLVAWLQKVTK